MAHPFECIGIPFPEGPAYDRVTGVPRVRGERIRRADGSNWFRWQDESGARLILNTDATDRVSCILPSFAATGRIKGETRALVKDPRCPYCDRLCLQVGEGLASCTIVLHVEDAVGLRENFKPGRSLEMEIAAFAEDLQAWESVEEYLQSGPISSGADLARRLEGRKTARMVLPAESCVPVGMQENPPAAHAIFTGTLVEAQPRINRVFGGPFWFGRMKTVGGEIDLVSARTPGLKLQKGGVAQGRMWLIGRPVAGVAWWRRFTGKFPPWR